MESESDSVLALVGTVVTSELLVASVLASVCGGVAMLGGDVDSEGVVGCEGLVV